MKVIFLVLVAAAVAAAELRHFHGYKHIDSHCDDEKIVLFHRQNAN